MSVYPRMASGFAVVEFNVRPDSKVTSYTTGTRQAKSVKTLLALPQLDFVTVYCLAYDTPYAFSSNLGVRNESRIKAWKTVFGLPQ